MSPPASTRPDGAGRKKRPRPLPHVNARNLAIEKKRREQMNGNFLDLAHLVPSLANTQRLTKVHIVSQTIEHLRDQRELCATAAQDMQELLAENYRLATELSMLRSSVQGVTAVPEQVRPVPPSMARLVAMSQLGSGGTATLRDAHEGPEPRNKTALEITETGAEANEPAAGFSPPLQDNNPMQLYGSLWNSAYDITGIPEAQQNTHLWNSSISNFHPDGSLLAPAGVPTPPRDGFDAGVFSHLAYPSSLLPDDSFNNARTTENMLGDFWSGTGIC